MKRDGSAHTSSKPQSGYSLGWHFSSQLPPAPARSHLCTKGTEVTTQDAHLHHLGYVVVNMDRSIKQFVDEGAELEITPTDDPIQRVTCAMLRLADGTGVELVAALEPDDSPITSRLRRGGGLDHICYQVGDVQAALDEEEASGAAIVCAPVHAATFNEMIGFALRRSGLLVEYMSQSNRA